jgi:hypothetical protein
MSARDLSGAAPDRLPPDAPRCQNCKHVVWEQWHVGSDWHRMHCGKFRELAYPFRPQAACWWERYGIIGRCGPSGLYFEPVGFVLPRRDP